MMKVVSWLKRGRASSGRGKDPASASSSQLEEGVEQVQKVDTAIQAAVDPRALGDEERVVEGSTNEVKPATAPRKISAKRKLGLRSLLLVFVGIVGIGLARIARESRYVSRVMALRYEAVYSRGLLR